MIFSVSSVRQEEPLRELSLPPNTSTVLSFFAVPISLQSFYRDRVFPVFQEMGFVPTTADDVVSPGDVVQAKIEAILDRSFLFVVDISTQQTLVEWRLAAKRISLERILVISGHEAALPSDSMGLRVIRRPDIATGEFERFLAEIRQWVEQTAESSKEKRSNEPSCLLAVGEYRAAVIAAISMLEIYLRKHLKPQIQRLSAPVMPLRSLIEFAHAEGLLLNNSVDGIRESTKIRNNVVHSSRAVTRAQATEIVQGVTAICKL